MSNIKKRISYCLAIALVMGFIFNANAFQALASEDESSFTADIVAQLQTEDGSIHDLNDSIQAGTIIAVTSDSLTVNMSIKGVQLEIQNADIVSVQNEDDEENIITDYSILVNDIAERVSAQSADEGELYIAFIVDEDVLNNINEVYSLASNGDNDEADVDEADIDSVALVAGAFSYFVATPEAATTAETTTTETTTAAKSSSESGSTLANASSGVTATNTTATTLADGEYTIEIKGLEMDSDEEHSRAAADLNTSAKLIVTNGKIDVYFSSVGRELTFQNSSGTYENHTLSSVEQGGGEERSDGMDTTILRNYLLTVSSLDDEIIAKFPAGGSATGSLTYRIVFLQSTLKTVSTSSSTTTTAGTGTDTTTSNTKTGDETQALFVIFSLIISTVIIAYTLHIKKRNAQIL